MAMPADAASQSLLPFESERNPNTHLTVSNANREHESPLQAATTLSILNNSYQIQYHQDALNQPVSSSQHSFEILQPVKPSSVWLLKLKQLPNIYFQVCEFLAIQDLIELQLLNSRFLFQTKRISLKWAIYNSQDSAFWQTVTNFTSLMRKHPREYQVLGVNYDQESQHSRDLDRTFLLEDTEVIENNKLKLDKVLRALTKNGLYFQGLNYIASAFLTEHYQQNSYWYTRFILHKGGYFQNDLLKLSSLLEVLENMMRHHLPRLLDHLESQDLTVEYFAARWFIVVYSYDTSIQLMLKLWKLLALSDEKMIVCFTVSLLKKLQPHLLELEEQDINTLLKTRLKETISRLCQQELLLDAVDLYLQEFSGVRFGFDYTELEQHAHKNQIQQLC